MAYLIIFSFLSLFSGALALSFLDKEKKLKKYSRLILSLMLGYTLQGFTILAGSLVMRNLPLAAWILMGIVAVLGGYFWKKSVAYLAFESFQIKFLWRYLFLCIIAGIMLLLTFQSVIWSDGLPYGILKGWGDGAYHMDMIQVMAQAHPFSLQHPVAGGTSLTYTFFINFLSALLLRMGSSFSVAWHVPIFVYALGLVCGLWNITALFLKRGAMQIICVAVILFGGGLGFFLVSPQGETATSTQTIWERITSPQYEYTHADIRTGGKADEKNIDKNIVWITPVISFFSHQRSFLPAAGVAFLWLWGMFTYMDGHRKWKWMTLLGLLPIIHIHTTIAMGIFAIVFFAYAFAQKEKHIFLHAWRPIVVAAIISIPQLIYLLSDSLFSPSTSDAPSSLSLWAGWMTCTHNTSWIQCDPSVPGTDSSLLWFWIKNFGVLFGAWIVGWALLRKIKKDAVALISLISGSIIFLLANLIKFQPWEFDNNKLIFYWWVCAGIVFAYICEYALRRWSVGIKKYTVYVLVSICVLCAILSGGIDALARVRVGMTPQKNSSHYGYYGNETDEVSRYILKNTKVSDIFLTSSSANQFIPMRTGRAIYLGFEGWLWTQGRSDTVQKRKEYIHTFLQTGDPRTLCEQGVRYVYWDDSFTREYNAYLNQEIVYKNIQQVYEPQDADGILYKLKCET